MTISIIEFASINEATGDAIHPAQRRLAAQPLATFNRFAEIGAVRGVLVYNDSNTTGIHLRMTTDTDAGNIATQADPFVGPDGTAWILIPRKTRDDANDALYLYAVADT